MNTLRFFKSLFCATLLSASIASCDSDVIDDIEKEEDSSNPKTCELILKVTKENFADEPQSRSASSWENGDKIYLTFTTETGSSYGDALYKDGKWNVNFYGDLTKNVTTKCKAVYFENSRFESSTVVHLSDSTGIYEDDNGQYIFDGTKLAVTANLTPKTGRIRFAGAENDTITVHGITHHTSYDMSTGKFTTASGALKTSVKSGYTPYIYGEFSDSIQPRLIILSSTSGFTRLLPTSIFKKGESGYMTIPSIESHEGWQNSAIFKINGVEFTMIPVPYNGDFFLIAETETTTALYNVVMDETTAGNNMPKNYISESSWRSFLTNLNLKTSLNFYIPTYAEWQWAAKGGEKSQGYTYSGSNIVDEVAWYNGNSDSKVHEVKMLKPNELGIYDMSGNLQELFISGYTYYCGGGCYNGGESTCKTTYSTSGYNTNNYGLRLALRP